MLYGIVFVVVLFSVLVQGGLVPFVAARLRLPCEIRRAGAVRARHALPRRAARAARFTVAPGSTADGAQLKALTLGEDAWVSFVGRDGALVQVRGETELRAGDEVLVLADPADSDVVTRIFTQPAEERTS